MIQPAQRFGFRFGFVYLVLYSLGGVLAWVPFVGGYLWRAFTWIEHGLVAVAAWLLRLEGPVVRPPMSGSGDTRFDWVLAFALLVVALLVAIAWSIVSAVTRRTPRRTPRSDRSDRVLGEVLRVFTRFVLATAMMSYGFAKVFRTQFSSLDALQMTQSYADSSPMGLLWRFMDFSAPYTIFCGAVEAVAGVLLLHRRTATLGALVSAAAMVNVIVLNVSYDVPVKLYSTHLLVMALVVAGPDLPRIARALLGLSTHAKRPVAVLPLASLEKTRTALEGALGLMLLASMVTGGLERRRRWGDGAPRPALEGAYQVETFVRAGEERPPLTTDASRWESFAVGRFGLGRIRRMTGKTTLYRFVDDPDARVVRLERGGDEPPIILAYVRASDTELRLEGPFEGEPIVVTMKRVDESKLTLPSRGFHFVQEYPYYR